MSAACGKDHGDGGCAPAAHTRTQCSRWICLEGAAACGDPTQEQVYLEGLQPCWNRAKCEEDRAAERNCYRLTTASSFALLGEETNRGDENEGVKLSPGKRGGVVGRCLSFPPCSSLSNYLK